MRPVLPLTIAAVVVAGPAVPAQLLWQIGVFDNNYAEFACERNFPAYSETFPADVTFRIGASSPAKDWSFVHPGPADAWAGSREHPFVIEFTLADPPRVPLRLAVDLVDVQAQVPSSMTIKVNGVEGSFHLRNGKGDASLYDPRQGAEQVVSALLPAALFRQGVNTITLSSTGSWFIYDALSLSLEPEAAGAQPRLTSISLEPTVFFKRLPGNGELAQVVTARMTIDGPNEGLTLTVCAGEAAPQQVTTAPAVSFGTFEVELLIPAPDGQVPVIVEARLASAPEGIAARAETTLQPQRRWKVFIAPSTHTDIGYTDLQERVIARHLENTRRAIALCERYPAFGWNLEVAWQADMFQRERSPEECEQLYALAQSGRIGIQANYLNMLTGLCSHEELNRWLYYAHSLKRAHGVPFESALTTDVPTQVWSLPSTLAAAGIRYYATGMNLYRASTFNTLITGTPHWWEGPDGSRVLAYFAPGYAHAGGMLQSLDGLKGWLLAATRGRDEFPYDALFAYGAFGDNCPVDSRIAETAQRWADEYEYPKVILGPMAAYFRYMEQTYGEQLPKVRGDAGVYWEDGAASTARETALNRRAHEKALAADALFALSSILQAAQPPAHRLQELWRNILLFDEHTWGAWCSVSHPDDPQTIQQWAVKAGFAQAAAQQSEELSDQGFKRLASLVSVAEPSLLLFNPTSWEREGDVVEVVLPPGQLPADPHTRQPVPAVRVVEEGEARVLFHAPPLPPWGYTVLPLVPGEPGQPQEAVVGDLPVLENERAQLTVDPATGGVASFVDKATGQELVEQGATHTLNEYLYVSGGGGTAIVEPGATPAAELNIHTPTDVALRREVLPGLAQRMVVTARSQRTPSLRSVYTLWEHSARLDIRNTLTREEERTKEAAYFAFPFAAQQPEIRLEIPNGVMRPEVDQLPGACREWYCVQHWARITAGGRSIVWASLDAPLLTIGDINRGLWRQKLEVSNGVIYSYIMNNYWPTNYKAGQDGEFEFRYCLGLLPQSSDAAAARFGWQAAMPVQSTVIQGPQTGILPGGTRSFCAVRPETVMITAIKPAEVGTGAAIRLFSLDTQPMTAELRLGVPATSATLCNLVEEPLEQLQVNSGVVQVPVRPQQVTTVVVR